MHVIEFRGPNPGIGLVARNGTRGPEADLVEGFKGYIPECFRRWKGDVAIFHEPQMETGFPDLVVVEYWPQAFDDWSQERPGLGLSEIKIMQHLLHVKEVETAELVGTLISDRRGLVTALEKLLDAKMVTLRSDTWRPRSRASVFGIRSIVAIEAKVKNWANALQQAKLNYWFASQSYVLSPVERPTARVLERVHEEGVGVFLLNGSRVRHLRRAARHTIPASYGSWLFNEWIGRYLHVQK